MAAPAINQEQEAIRLQSLIDLQLLDTDPEPEFDELVQLASAICEAPISLMTLVDTHRQWFKASLGLAAKETPREVAFCAHAILRPELFIVENATEDERFARNPLVTGDPNIRFYAGMPLEASEGQRVGTLCVIDTVPRHLSDSQREALRVLGRQVSARMQLRQRQRLLEDTLLEKEQIARTLQASEQMFRVFMDNSPFVSYIKSAEGRFLYYSEQFREQFGVQGDDWIGTSDMDHFAPEVAQAFQENDAAILKSGRGAIISETSPSPDGSVRYWQSHKFPCTDHKGGIVLGGVSVDVTGAWHREIELEASKLELEEANARLKLLSNTDALTGLRNRRAFEQRLTEEFAMARRKRRPLTVAMLDIDHFKLVNDQYGHAEGDQVLRQVAAILQQSVRISDMAARYGGEEFAVILRESDADSAQLWARRLERMLAKAEWPHGAITLSIGVAALAEEQADAAQLVENADKALYEAKRKGRARTELYGRHLAAED